MNEEKRTLSLLEALGAKKHEIEIEGQTFPFLELTAEQVGNLIEQLEKAAKAGVSVMDYFDSATGKTEHFLKEDNWWKMAAESRHFFYHLIGYSLGVAPDEAAQIAVRHYPALLKKAYEVSGDFFDSSGALLKGIMSRVPALASALNAVQSLRPQVEEAETSGPSPGHKSYPGLVDPALASLKVE